MRTRTARCRDPDGSASDTCRSRARLACTADSDTACPRRTVEAPLRLEDDFALAVEHTRGAPARRGSSAPRPRASPPSATRSDPTDSVIAGASTNSADCSSAAATARCPATRTRHAQVRAVHARKARRRAGHGAPRPAGAGRCERWASASTACDGRSRSRGRLRSRARPWDARRREIATAAGASGCEPGANRSASLPGGFATPTEAGRPARAGRAPASTRAGTLDAK